MRSALLYKGHDGASFTEAESQIFTHACFVFNIHDEEWYKEDVGGDPPPLLTPSSIVLGLKIFGVFLISGGNDYRSSAFKFFSRPHFTLNNDDELLDVVVEGGSFAAVLNNGEQKVGEPPYNSYCFNLTASHPKTIGIIKGAVRDKPKFCTRDEEDPITAFDKMFHLNLEQSSYNWKGCELNDDERFIDEETGSLREPKLPIQLPDFRTLDPKFISEQGSPGKVFNPNSMPAEEDSSAYEFMQQLGQRGKPQESESEHQVHAVSADFKDCEEFPEIPDPCGDSDSEAAGCTILKQVLTLEEPNLLPSDKWRQRVISTATQVYAKICPQVSRALAPALSRIMFYFFERVGEAAVKDDAKWTILNGDTKSEWEDKLLPILENCSSRAHKIPLYRTKDLENYLKKKQIEKMFSEFSKNPETSGISLAELEEKIQDIRVMFPYNIWIPAPMIWANGTQIRIEKRVEVAEVRYRLDWAIDTFWKVISTVLGYCYQFYEDSKDQIYAELYEAFATDIFDLVMEQWTQYSPDPMGDSFKFGNFDEIYDKLFGEFIHGVASRYIDACNTAAYYWANAFSIKHLRPITLLFNSKNDDSKHSSINYYMTPSPFFAN